MGGIPNSGLVNDQCDICGGDSSSCAGCNGVPNSGVTFDACGICDGDSSCTNCEFSVFDNVDEVSLGLVFGDNSVLHYSMEDSYFDSVYDTMIDIGCASSNTPPMNWPCNTFESGICYPSNYIATLAIPNSMYLNFRGMSWDNACGCGYYIGLLDINEVVVSFAYFYGNN